MSRFFVLASASSAAFSLFLSSARSRADVTSWLYAGAGATSLARAGLPTPFPFTLQTELGIGSPPNGAVIVGGLVKALTFVGQGTDVGFTARGATGGYVRGGFGFAVDAGIYERWWDTNSSGFLGAITFGAPLGLQIAATTEQGSHGVHSYGFTMGIDFLRLTVYRTSTQNFWPNPIFPLGVTATR